MATPLDTPVHLKERESLRLQNGTGLEVRCLLGNLWITEEPRPTWGRYRS